MTSKNWIYVGIATAVVIMVLLILAGRDLPENDLGLQEIKISYLSGTGLGVHFPLFVAQEKKFFEEEGLKVILKEMAPAASVPALLAEEVDYITFIAPAVTASLKKAPIKTFMLTGRYLMLHLVARPDLELSEINTVGIFFRGSLMHYQALKFIKEKNLAVEIVDTHGDSAALAVLLPSGTTDAILHETRYALQLRAEGFPILVNFDDVLPTGLSTRTEKIENSPEEVKRVVRSVQKAMEFIVANPEETKELILKFWNVEKTEENLQIAEESYFFLRTALDRRDVPVDEGAEILLQIAKAGMFETIEEVEKEIIDRKDIDGAFDFQFVE